MSIIDKLLGPVGDVVSSILNKVASDKIPGEVKMRLELEMQRELRTALQNEEDNFRNFILEYEGSARDLPKSMQMLRTSVRPTITYFLVGLFAYGMWGNWDVEQMGMIFKLNLLTCFFWFGEKAVKNAGVVELLRGKGK